MKVIVIGHAGHEKNTLAKAIELLGKQGVEAGTSELIDLMKEQKEREKQLEEYAKKEIVLAEPTPNRETRRGNRKLKSWQWKR